MGVHLYRKEGGRGVGHYAKVSIDHMRTLHPSHILYITIFVILLHNVHSLYLCHVLNNLVETYWDLLGKYIFQRKDCQEMFPCKALKSLVNGCKRHMDKLCPLSSSDLMPIKCTKEACDRLRENLCVDSNKPVSCLCENKYNCSGAKITRDFVNKYGME